MVKLSVCEANLDDVRIAISIFFSLLYIKTAVAEFMSLFTGAFYDYQTNFTPHPISLSSQTIYGSNPRLLTSHTINAKVLRVSGHFTLFRGFEF